MEEMKNEVLQVTAQEEPYKSGSVHYIDSRDVAEMVGKQHKDLMRDIRRYTTHFNESKIAPVDFWVEGTYADSKGENRSCYLITEKGCEFIAHKLTGQKGSDFTARYIDRFHEMKGALEGQAELNKFYDVMKEYIIHQSKREDKQEENIQVIARVVSQMTDILTGLSTEVENLQSQNKDPVTDQNPAEHPHRPVYIREKSMRDEEILCYRRKRLNSLVNKVSRLNGMKRNAILHNLYKRLEDELEISLDSYMDVYQAETGRFDFTTMEVVIAYDFLCKNAILLLSKMTKDLSCEEDELE